MSVFTPRLGDAGGGLTAAQYAANLRTAENLVFSELGLSREQLPNLDYDTRLKYNHLLAQVILQHPDSFDEMTVSNAYSESGRNDSPLLDNSFLTSASEFGSNVEDNLLSAGSKVADVGKGALDLTSGLGKLLTGAGKGAENTATAAKWLLPVAGAAALAILLVALSGKTGAAQTYVKSRRFK